MIFQPRALAEAGAKLLDDKFPDWYTRIDLGKLDMASEDLCVLAQLYGSFTKGCEALHFHANRADDFGFYVEGLQLGPFLVTPLRRYQRLTEAWKYEVAHRLTYRVHPLLRAA